MVNSAAHTAQLCQLGAFRAPPGLPAPNSHPVLLGSKCPSPWEEGLKAGVNKVESSTTLEDTSSEASSPIYLSRQSTYGADEIDSKFPIPSEKSSSSIILSALDTFTVFPHGLDASSYQPGRILQNEAMKPSERPALSLENALADSSELVVPPPPPPPAPTMASVGSIGHHLGLCKPCDFASRFGNGCRAGTACKFCHLCGPENLRKSKKQRRAFARAAQ